MVRAGLTLAIVGRPNVGKSSLFNRLLEQDRAIVTDIPGTTRDLVSETAAIAGIPVKLYDTAGIRESAELVETLGIERSYQAMADADLTLVVVDLSQPLDEQDRALIARAAPPGPPPGGRQQVRPVGAARPAQRFRHPRFRPDRRRHRATARSDSRGRWPPKALSSRRPVSSPACATSNCCANPPGTWKRRAPRSKPAFRTRCCCSISTPLCGPSTPSPAPPPRTTSSTASSPRSASENEPMNTENDRRIDYIEFPCADTARVKQFYGAVLDGDSRTTAPATPASTTAA